MQAENMFDIVNHASSTSSRPARRHLFRGLEDEFNAAVQLFAKLAQDFRRPISIAVCAS